MSFPSELQSELQVFNANLAKARENRQLPPHLGDDLSQYVVPTVQQEVAGALRGRVDSDPELKLPQVEDDTNPLTLSPKGPSPRFSDEWYVKTAHLHPGANPNNNNPKKTKK